MYRYDGPVDGYSSYGEPPPLGWPDGFDRYGAPEPPDSTTLICILLGCAVGIVLSLIPALRRRRDDLVELGAAIAALVGICLESDRP